MVVGLLDHEQSDEVFRALADPTRRDIVRRAIGGGYSVSELARAYPMSFAAVQKHVAVLERAALVSKEKLGRRQIVRTNINTIRSVQVLFDDLEAMWRDRLDRFGEALATTDPPATPDPSASKDEGAQS